jgi:hypothetical protein
MCSRTPCPAEPPAFDAWVLRGEPNETEPAPLRGAHRARRRLNRPHRLVDDWLDQLHAHPLLYGDTMFPDWPSIAARWAAAHPRACGGGRHCLHTPVSEISSLTPVRHINRLLDDPGRDLRSGGEAQFGQDVLDVPLCGAG